MRNRARTFSTLTGSGLYMKLDRRKRSAVLLRLSSLTGLSAMLLSCSHGYSQVLPPGVQSGQRALSGSSATVNKFRVRGYLYELHPDGRGGVWIASNAQNTTTILPNESLDPSQCFPLGTCGHSPAWMTHVPASGGVNVRKVAEDSGLSGFAVVSSGAIYFTDEFKSEVGVLAPNGDISRYPTPTANSYPVDPVAGPKGVWFAEGGGDFWFAPKSEAIGKISSSGHIVERRIPRMFPGAAGAGADYLQNDGHGGLWFVGTLHLLVCAPRPCFPFIGHLSAGGLMTRRTVKFNPIWPVSDVDGLWSGGIYQTDINGATLSLIGINGAVKRFPIMNFSGVAPIGRIDGQLWAMTELPFSLLVATPAGVTSIVPSLPGIGVNDDVSATVGGGAVWIVDNSTNPTLVFRYDPQTNTYETATVKGLSGCLYLGNLQPVPAFSGESLWGFGCTSGSNHGYAWRVSFPTSHSRALSAHELTSSAPRSREALENPITGMAPEADQGHTYKGRRV